MDDPKQQLFQELADKIVVTSDMIEEGWLAIHWNVGSLDNMSDDERAQGREAAFRRMLKRYLLGSHGC